MQDDEASSTSSVKCNMTKMAEKATNVCNTETKGFIISMPCCSHSSSDLIFFFFFFFSDDGVNCEVEVHIPDSDR